MLIINFYEHYFYEKFSVKDLNKLIDQTLKEDKSIQKIFIGYKLF